MPLLSGDIAETDFDVVIVGSGFGGSVNAYRLAEAGQRVCVLERGKAYPQGSFPRTPAGLARNLWDPSEGLHGMFDVWSFESIDALVSSGLGGGSLIYANVLIRKDESWFRQHHPYKPGVVEEWPISYQTLEPHYERVEKFIDVQKLPLDDPGFNLFKTNALRDAAATVGAPAHWDLAPLGVHFRGADGPVFNGPLADPGYPDIHGLSRRTCRLCGECDVGCNDGAKATLDHNYLSAASHLGAVISTRSEVRHIRRNEGSAGGFEVDYVVHAPEAEGRQTDTARLAVRTLRAKKVIVAAGTLGSTYLMLKNRKGLGLTTSALGTRFCGNGDLLGFIFGASRDGGARTLDGSFGPVITSYVRYPDWVDTGAAADLGMYIEDAGYPAFIQWMAEASKAVDTLKRTAHFAWQRVVETVTGRMQTNLSSEVSRILGPGRLSDTALPVLGMGRDVPDGALYLKDPNSALPELDSTWSTHTSQRYFDKMAERMAGLAKALGGHFEVNPTYMLRRVITVHPLGGCPMGADPKDGVVDPMGEVYGVPGLYVADGSVLPGPVGPNPSLTIAAFADRLADHLTGA